MSHIIDLRSDTVTRPTPAMREAMAKAPVGDDVYGEDPSVNALQEKAARMFGKEAALFVPTGTMANLLAALSQSRPGDTIILSEDAHPFIFESGNLAMVAGLLTRTVRARQGIMDPAEVEKSIIKTSDHHFSQTTLVAVENTANRGGGSIYPWEVFTAIGRLAREKGLAYHCDGARIFNAVVETGIGPAQWAAHVDTISFCLSKGLGCPVGSLLLGTAATIDTAHRFRKMLGGGMRQAGILAAAGLYALDNHVDRLKEDHRRAREFRALIERAGFTCPYPSPTNMVYVTVSDASAFAERLARFQVRAGVTAPDMLRFVFHLDIGDEDVQAAAEAVIAARD